MAELKDLLKDAYLVSGRAEIPTQTELPFQEVCNLPWAPVCLRKCDEETPFSAGGSCSNGKRWTDPSFWLCLITFLSLSFKSVKWTVLPWGSSKDLNETA